MLDGSGDVDPVSEEEVAGGKQIVTVYCAKCWFPSVYLGKGKLRRATAEEHAAAMATDFDYAQAAGYALQQAQTGKFRSVLDTPEVARYLKHLRDLLEIGRAVRDWRRGRG
jgi:hypothetical protein